MANTSLLQLMHDTVGKVNNVKSLGLLIKEGKLHADEVGFAIDTIIKLADQINEELDTYYIKTKSLNQTL